MGKGAARSQHTFIYSGSPAKSFHDTYIGSGENLFPFMSLAGMIWAWGTHPLFMTVGKNICNEANREESNTDRRYPSKLRILNNKTNNIFYYWI